VAKLRRFWTWKRQRGESLDANAPLFANQSRRRISKRRVLAAASGVRPNLRVPCAAAHGGHERVPSVDGPVLGAAVREAREPVNNHRLHPPKRRRGSEAGTKAELLAPWHARSYTGSPECGPCLQEMQPPACRPQRVTPCLFERDEPPGKQGDDVPAEMTFFVRISEPP
jgi:hypothetical protein